MLTPVDIQNKVFKGGIGFDKRDVEIFMSELASDYEQLYRSNVELKDKVTTLTESLQHYRSTEDSMQKALTLSEKTAEETVIAAKDKARQIINESTKKAETLLANSKQELIETKDEIYRLKQLYTKFKTQYTQILRGQLQLIENKVVDIDLGDEYEAHTSNNSDFSYAESGLGSLGDGGGYTGSSSFDDRFEHTNQEPAFDRGSLNMDPFADAANGGGRFSRQTGKGFTGTSSKSQAHSTGESKSTLNVKSSTSSSPKVRKNFTSIHNTAAPAVDKPVEHPSVATPINNKPVEQTSTVTPANAKPVEQASTVAPSVTLNTSASTEKPASNTNNTVDTSKAAFSSQASNHVFQKEASVAGEVENKIKESSLIDNNDDVDEGFDFMNADNSSESTLSEEKGVISGEVENHIDESTLLGNDDDDNDGFSFMNVDSSEESSSSEQAGYSDDDGIVSGDIEEPISQSMMIGSEDNSEEGFDFLNVGESNISSEEEDSFSFSTDEFSMDDDTYSGEVEDKINEATMLESEDDINEGFDFLVGNESEEDDIPTITPDLSLNLNFGTFSNSSDESSDDNKDETQDVFVGNVEAQINQSNLIGNGEEDDDGFSFL